MSRSKSRQRVLQWSSSKYSGSWMKDSKWLSFAMSWSNGSSNAKSLESTFGEVVLGILRGLLVSQSRKTRWDLSCNCCSTSALYSSNICFLLSSDNEVQSIRASSLLKRKQSCHSSSTRYQFVPDTTQKTPQRSKKPPHQKNRSPRSRLGRTRRSRDKGLDKRPKRKTSAIDKRGSSKRVDVPRNRTEGRREHKKHHRPNQRQKKNSSLTTKLINAIGHLFCCFPIRRREKSNARRWRWP